MTGKPDIYGVGYKDEFASKREVRLGMIGVGGVAQAKHLPSLNRLVTMWEPVKLVAVADPDERSGQKVARQYGAKWYADYREMLKNEQLDGVDIATPDRFHAEQVRECLEAGLHVMVEKPLAHDRVLAYENCCLADSRNLVLMTAFCKRYSPPYERAKALIQNGSIGEVTMLGAKMCQAWAPVGLLERQHCHVFDMIRYLMGNVSSVHGFGINRYRKNGYDVDNIVVNFRFESGAIGTFYGSSTALSYKPWERVEVFGEYKWLAVEDQFRLVVYDDEQGPAKVWEPAMPNTTLMDEEFGGYVGEMRDFICAIRGESSPRATGWDGYRALELADAIKLSLREKREVNLPLATVEEVLRPGD